MGACFSCGKQGHIIRDYPRRRQMMPMQQPQMILQNEAPQYNNFQRPPTQGKVYAITHEEMENSRTVVTK